MYRIAVVGSGPSGLYATKYLLDNPLIHIDVFEKLFTPFGLIRYGNTVVCIV
jgi:ribulose 1,5-bisphosphate synthetase/thiazole synthase